MAIPVILVGLSEAIGGKVASNMGPEFEVIQFIQSVERAKSEIVDLTAGRPIQQNPDSVGTHNFDRPPEAVVFGRGFDVPVVEEIVQACRSSTAGLIWVRGDDEGIARVRATPPNEQAQGPEGYAVAAARSMKSALLQIKEDGGWGKGGVHTYH